MASDDRAPAGGTPTTKTTTDDAAAAAPHVVNDPPHNYDTVKQAILDEINRLGNGSSVLW